MWPELPTVGLSGGVLSRQYHVRDPELVEGHVYPSIRHLVRGQELLVKINMISFIAGQCRHDTYAYIIDNLPLTTEFIITHV